MNESPHLRDLLILLAAAVAIVPVVRRIGVSAVLGYLAAGALIGPFALDLLHDVEATELLGEFGVVFLLFAIGLELSVDRLVALRRLVFGLGGAQVVGTGLAVWGAARLLGVPTAPALVLGGGLALSSTAIVLQMLVERRELSAPHGRAAFAVLLFQDLAVVPLLVLVTLLGEEGGGVLGAIGSALGRAVGMLVAIGAAGRLLLRPVLHAVARGRNPELFTGITLLLVLGVGWITQLAGLSMAMGAFLAGLLIAETEFRPQIEGDIEPFRGILLALFFMTVGMGIDLRLVAGRLPLVLALVGGLLLLKALLLAALCRAFGLPGGVSVRTGVMLAQGGEFGFILFALAAQSRVLPAPVEQLAVAVVGVSMALTPLLMAAARWAGERLAAAEPGEGSIAAEVHGVHGHVLITGFGRVGQTLVRILEERQLPYVALDADAELVAEARSRGLPVFYGDASRADVLRAAGAERARAAVVTLDQPDAARRAVRALRRLVPELPIVVRARDVEQCAGLQSIGATAVVPELVEGSLQLGGSMLRTLGASPEEVEQLLGEFRRRTYARLGELIETDAGPPAG